MAKISALLWLIVCTCALAQTPLTREQALRQQAAELERLVARFGGYPAIESTLAPLRAEILLKIVNSSERYTKVKDQEFQAGITGASMMATWPSTAADGKKSGYEVVVDLHQQLAAMGVDLIFVPVPSKFELYPDVFEVATPPGLPLNPARIEVMQRLTAAGVEVIDILPTLQALKPQAAHPLYEVRGHHVSSYGAKHAGELVASHLARYQVPDRDLARFSFQERASVERVNSEQPMTAFEVLLDGKPYEHVNNSPFIVIGDSQAFAHFGAGWASHIARASGVPITDMSLSSGGTWAAQRLGHLGRTFVRKAKAVIWIVTSAGLSRPDWEAAVFKDEATVPGLMALGLFEEAKARVGDHPDPAALGIEENYVNEAAYRMVATRKFAEAEAAFLLNVACFPQSANSYDSLGEFYARRDRKEEAVAACTKALSLNPPDNVKRNSLATLRRLGVDTSQWEPERPKIELTAEQKSIYVGSYLLTKDTRLEVALSEQQLIVHVMGRKVPMIPTGEHRFEANGLLMTFHPEGEDMLLSCRMGSDTRAGKRVVN